MDRSKKGVKEAYMVSGELSASGIGVQWVELLLRDPYLPAYVVLAGFELVRNNLDVIASGMQALKREVESVVGEVEAASSGVQA